MLALQDRVGGAAARAVVGVAGRADGGRDGRALGRVGLRSAARSRRRGGAPAAKSRASEQSKRGTGFMRRAGSRAKASDFTMRALRRSTSTSMPTSAAAPEAAGDDAADGAAGRSPGPTPRAFSPPRASSPSCRSPSCPRSRSSAAPTPASRPRSTSLTQQKRLAFASKTPGRTQHINLFELGPKLAADALFADLPGYGYAAVERNAKLRWQEVMADYLDVRRSLSAIVVLVDSRLGFTDIDRKLLDFVAPRLANGSVKLLVLLTKADKLNRAATPRPRSAGRGRRARRGRRPSEATSSLTPFSALSRGRRRRCGARRSYALERTGAHAHDRDLHAVSLGNGITLSCRAAGRAARRCSSSCTAFPRRRSSGTSCSSTSPTATAASRRTCAATSDRRRRPTSRRIAPSTRRRHRALIDALGGSVEALVAHDWGGALAWGLAAQRPEAMHAWSSSTRRTRRRSCASCSTTRRSRRRAPT